MNVGTGAGACVNATDGGAPEEADGSGVGVGTASAQLTQASPAAASAPATLPATSSLVRRIGQLGLSDDPGGGNPEGAGSGSKRQRGEGGTVYGEPGGGGFSGPAPLREGGVHVQASLPAAAQCLLLHPCPICRTNEDVAGVHSGMCAVCGQSVCGACRVAGSVASGSCGSCGSCG